MKPTTNKRGLKHAHQAGSAGLRMMFALAATAFLMALLAAPAEPPDARPAKAGRPDLPPPLSIPRFEDKTLDYGIAFVHQQGEENLGSVDEVLGPGACAFDFDQDGWVDLFLVNGAGQTRHYGKPFWWQGRTGHALLKNVNGKRFEDVTQSAGLSGVSNGMGCVSADFDNDGDADLLVTSLGGNALHRNNGDGTFADATRDSGLAGAHWSTSVAVADFDHDGLLDIYIANYVNFNKGAHTYEPSAQFSGDTPISFQGSYYEPQPNLLYRNVGHLKFVDATADMNAGNGEGRTLGVAWGDLNDDGWPDLILANDQGVASSTALVNDKGRGFSAGGTRYGLDSSAGHHGIGLGDIDNDQALDIVFSSDKHASPLLLMKNADPSRLYSDKARDAGVDTEQFAGLSGWTPGLHDFNNDGRLDLFMANGLLIPDQDVGRVPVGQPKQLWLNTGQFGFAEVSRQAGVALSDAQSARGAAFADFDNDGDVDVYVAHNNDLGQLLVNQSPPGNHWLGLRLQGTADNRDAIGARVVVATDHGLQTRWVAAGSGFLSDSDRRLNFGLGQADTVQRVEIRWPGGAATELRGLPADRYYRVSQGGGAAVAEAIPGPPPGQPPRLSLAVGEDDPANRIAYLQLVSSVLGMESALGELSAGAQDPDPAVREAVVDLLHEPKTPAALRVLTRALSDPVPAVAGKAVGALCAYEDEAGVRWMLRAFKSPEEAVLVKLADCFGYFYQEEEAVIHRKYLALPHLIRLLQDGRSQVQIAAARALANAERYRAVQPLMDKLADSDPDVRAEAIRALGLTREGKATPAILGALQSPGQSPAVYAQALIALKRLAIPGFDKIQHDFVSGEGRFEALAAELRLGAARFVLDHPDDGVVLNRDELLGLVETWARRALPGLLREDSGQAAAALVAVLKLDPRPESLEILRALKNHANPEVRAQALAGLLALDRDNPGQYVNAGLADPAVPVRLAVLRAVDQAGPAARLPAPPLLRALDSPDTRLAAISALSRVGGQEVGTRLLEIAAAPSESPETAEAALNAAASRPSGPIELADAVYRHPDARVRRAAFLAWAGHQPDFVNTGQMPGRFAAALADGDEPLRLAACQALLKRQEAWALREIEARLADPKTDSSMKACLLEKHPVSMASPAGRQLMKSALSKEDPSRGRWLARLLDSAEPAAEKLAWQLLQDQNEAPQIRMVAAKSLSARHGLEVLERLQGR